MAVGMDQGVAGLAIGRSPTRRACQSAGRPDMGKKGAAGAPPGPPKAAQPARDAVGVFAVTRRWRQGGLNSRRGRGARADHRRAARRRRNGPELWGGAEAPASRTRSEPRISRRHRGVINDGCEPLQGRCVKPLTSFSWPSSVAKISHASSWRDRRQTQHVASKDVAANNVPQGAQATRRTVLS